MNRLDCPDAERNRQGKPLPYKRRRTARGMLPICRWITTNVGPPGACPRAAPPTPKCEPQNRKRQRCRGARCPTEASASLPAGAQEPKCCSVRAAAIRPRRLPVIERLAACWSGHRVAAHCCCATAQYGIHRVPVPARPHQGSELQACRCSLLPIKDGPVQDQSIALPTPTPCPRSRPQYSPHPSCHLDVCLEVYLQLLMVGPMEGHPHAPPHVPPHRQRPSPKRDCCCCGCCRSCFCGSCPLHVSRHHVRMRTEDSPLPTQEPPRPRCRPFDSAGTTPADTYTTHTHNDAWTTHQL